MTLIVFFGYLHILHAVVDCDCPPVNFTKATLNDASYETTYDSLAYYTCDEGYDPVHSAGVFSRCLSNGSWSEPEHPCQGLNERTRVRLCLMNYILATSGLRTLNTPEFVDKHKNNVGFEPISIKYTCTSLLFVAVIDCGWPSHPPNIASVFIDPSSTGGLMNSMQFDCYLEPHIL